MKVASFIQTILAAVIKAKRKYLEPRFTITEWVEKNLPDWYIDGSSPAKASNLAGESNLEISPISARIEPAVLKEIPGIDSIGELISFKISFILFSTSSSCSCINWIILIVCFNSNETESLFRPIDFLASSLIWIALSLSNFLLELSDKRWVKCVRLHSAIFLAFGNSQSKAKQDFWATSASCSCNCYNAYFR